MRIIFLSALAILLTSGSALAAPGDDPACVPYRYRVHWTGEYDNLYYADAVEVVDDLAYVADRALGLRIVDVADPFDPVRAGGAEFGAGAQDLVVEYPLVYLALGPYGLRVMDVTDPMAPTLVDTLGLPGTAGHMVKQGDVLVVSCGPGGLQLVDASDPADLGLLGGVSLGVNMRDVAVSGTTAFVGYLAGGAGTVRAIDIADPAAPAPLGSVAVPAPPTGMALLGDLLYVTCGDVDSAADGCLQVLDVGVPGAPAAGAVLPQPPGAMNVLPEGDGLWTCGALDGGGNYGYLHAFDLTDPALPVFVSQTVLRHWVEDIDPVNGHLCLAAGYDPGSALYRRGSLQVVARPSLEVATAPVVLELASVTGVTVLDGLAFLPAGADGLRVVDVLDPAAPAEIAVIGTSGQARDVAVQDGFAYVADGANGLQVVDVTDPFLPTLRGAAGVGDAHAVAVSGTLACVASVAPGDTSGYFEVIEISDPDNPIPGGGCATGARINELLMHGSYVYAAMEDSVFKVIELDLPNWPATCAELPLAGHPRALARDGDHVYVAGHPDIDQGRLWVIDVSDPLSPVQVADVAAPAQAYAVAVGGALVYLGLGEAGTAVYDVTVPAAPVLVGVIGGPGGALAATPDAVYFSLADHGLQIAGLPCGDISGTGPSAAPLVLAGPRAHPNPFNPRATITFTMARSERVEVAVYDLAGRRIAVLADRIVGAGEQTVLWDGRNLAGRDAPSGVYLLRLTTRDRVLGGKATLLR